MAGHARAVKDRALIGAPSANNFPRKGNRPNKVATQRETAVAILNVGGGDDAVQQQALRIDQLRHTMFPPFSAILTDDAGRGAGFARGFLAHLPGRAHDGCSVPSQQAEVMHGASGRARDAGAQNVHHVREARNAPIPHRSGRSDNAVCRGCMHLKSLIRRRGRRITDSRSEWGAMRMMPVRICAGKRISGRLANANTRATSPPRTVFDDR